MLAILHSLGMFIVDLFKSRCRLEAENLFLRHQLSIALTGLSFYVWDSSLPWLSPSETSYSWVSLSGKFDVDELKLQAETASEPAPCPV
jgi:hypothetical protein